MDDQIVDTLYAQIIEPVKHITADKMYDIDAVFETLMLTFPLLTLSFPPKIIRLLMKAIILKE